MHDDPACCRGHVCINVPVCVMPCTRVMQEREPRLPMLLKLMLWAQAQLDERAQYPRITDLVTAQLTSPDQQAAKPASD